MLASADDDSSVTHVARCACQCWHLLAEFTRNMCFVSRTLNLIHVSSTSLPLCICFQHGKVVERPQHMLMRVALGIHLDDVDAAIETYNLMADKWFTHASPTMFNAGTPNPQMSSCFLLHMVDDSIEGIYGTLKRCALISKAAGGIGLSSSNIRASGSYIRGTNGQSNGLIPMLRVFNNTARFVSQGGGKRQGSFAIYLEPWHGDIYEFLDLKKNHGIEASRARDLFYALWIPDLFMKRVEANGEWSLMCPNECPGLVDTWGDEFEANYARYETEGKVRRSIKAQELWFAILDSQIETGTPYILYKDSANRKSNQQNLGTIRCSNLCTEIIEYTAPDEVAVCNLASIALPRFVDGTAGEFDHAKLRDITYIVTKNLNKVRASCQSPCVPLFLGHRGFPGSFTRSLQRDRSLPGFHSCPLANLTFMRSSGDR